MSFYDCLLYYLRSQIDRVREENEFEPVQPQGISQTDFRIKSLLHNDSLSKTDRTRLKILFF